MPPKRSKVANALRGLLSVGLARAIIEDTTVTATRGGPELGQVHDDESMTIGPVRSSDDGEQRAALMNADDLGRGTFKAPGPDPSLLYDPLSRRVG